MTRAYTIRHEDLHVTLVPDLVHIPGAPFLITSMFIALQKRSELIYICADVLKDRWWRYAANEHCYPSRLLFLAAPGRAADVRTRAAGG